MCSAIPDRFPSRQAPVAVVGLSCRLPGAADLTGFWELLRSGTDVVAPLSGTDPRSDTGAVPERGGFVDYRTGAPLRFGISSAEVAAMDPHQGLVLELVRESLADAGLANEDLRDVRSGVFIGAMSGEHTAQPIPEQWGAGARRGDIRDRLSYAFGLRGPSMMVSTTESSSLVAVHLACETIRSGETRLAVAGGVSLMFSPEYARTVAELGVLSPRGRCAVFDARADGYARGEGGVVAVLKSLDAAVADGDRVYCALIGSAVDNGAGTDGQSTSQLAVQEEVLRRACAAAGTHPGSVQYVELNGTGTPHGDAVEAAALGAVFGNRRPVDTPLRVGAVTTNIGYLEAASGVAGLGKVVLALYHRLLPRTLHHESPHPGIPLAALNLRVHTETGAWPLPDRRLIAGVSSFGTGGTSCHVLLEDA